MLKYFNIENLKKGLIYIKKIVDFFKGQAVLCISAIAAVVTCFIVTPDKHYAGYVDTDVLILLFCLMGAVSGFTQAGLFDKVTSSLTKSTNARKLAFLLMNVCFFSSMLVTNDVALITFVPLAVMIYEKCGKSKDFILTVVIQTVGANLGSMLTPVGNPQNLFIYSKFNLTLGVFFKTLLPLGILSYITLTLMCFFVSKDNFEAVEKETIPLEKGRIFAFFLIFVVCILTVVRVIPHIICLVVCVLGFVLANRRVFFKIDYALLLTFVCFFVFVGNLGRIDAVESFIVKIMEGKEILVSATLSQIISNVPAAVMLSQFTDDFSALLKGVNIGGLGTPIASLASLISFKIYAKSKKAENGKYLGIFSAVNFPLLAVLMLFAVIL